MTEPEAIHTEENQPQPASILTEDTAETGEAHFEAPSGPDSGLPDPNELYSHSKRRSLPAWLLAVLLTLLGVLVLLGAGFGGLRLLENSALNQASVALTGQDYSAAETAATRALALPLKSLQAQPMRAYLLRGQALLHQGRLDEALQDLMMASRSYPQDAGLQNSLAQIYLNQGDLEKAAAAGAIARQADDSLALPYALDALKAYKANAWGEALSAAEAALQRGDESGLARRIRAALELWTQDFEAARADLDAAVEQVPEDVEILALRVYLYTEANQNEDAAAALAALQTISTDSAVSLWAQGLVAYSQYRYAEAQSLASQALAQEERPEFYLLRILSNVSQSPEAEKQGLEDIAQALKLNADFFPVLFLQAKDQIEQYQLTDFEPVVQRLEQLAPKTYLTQLLRCEHEIMYYYLDEALTYCKLAVERAPQIASTHAMLSGLHSIRNEYDAAWSEIESALALSPEGPYSLRIAIGLARKLDEGEKAMGYADELLKTQDGVAWAHGVRAQLYFDDKEYRLANTELEKAIQLDPYDRDAIDARIMISLNNDDTLTALNDANDRIKRNPKDPQNYVSRGWVYFYDEKLDKAKQDANMAISLNKRSADAYVLLASIYDAQEDNSTTILYADKAIELYPYAPHPYQLMSSAYCKMWSPEKCISNSEKAAELAPWDESIQAMLATTYSNTGKIEESLGVLEKLVEKRDELDVDTLDKVESLYSFVKTVAPIVDGQRTQVDTKHKFSVTYPTSWIPQPPENNPFNDGSLYWQINAGGFSSSDYAQIYLYVYDYDGANRYPAAAWAYAFRQDYVDFTRFQFFTSKTFRAAGITGTAEEFQFEDSYGENDKFTLQFRLKNYVFIQGDTVYLFQYLADPESYDTYLAEADQIVLSFVIPN